MADNSTQDMPDAGEMIPEEIAPDDEIAGDGTRPDEVSEVPVGDGPDEFVPELQAPEHEIMGDGTRPDVIPEEPVEGVSEEIVPELQAPEHEITGDGTRPDIIPEELVDAPNEAVDPALFVAESAVVGDGTRPDYAQETTTAPEADDEAMQANLAAEVAHDAADSAAQDALEAIAAAKHAAMDAVVAKQDAQSATAEFSRLMGEDASGDGQQPQPDMRTTAELPFAERYRRAIKLDAKTAEYLTYLYLQRRLNYQINYYSARIKDYDKNSYFLFRVGAFVMAFSTLLAALNTAVSSAELQIFIAVLPAMAALIAGFRQLYNWDRQAALYRDTIFNLEESRLILPDLDQLTPEKALEVYPQLVVDAEDAFGREVSQWGQLARGKTSEGQDIDQIKEFARQFNLDVFDDDGNVNEAKLGDLANVVRAASGGPGSPQSRGIDIDFQQVSQDLARGASDASAGEGADASASNQNPAG